MKTPFCIVVWSVAAMAMLPCLALAKVSVNQTLYSTPGLCYSTAPVFDIGDYDRTSVQVTYSSGTYGAITFTEGVKSNATITVGSNFALLAPATASVLIKVASNTTTALDGAYITIEGHPFRNGIEWTRQTTATGTAASIAAAIDAVDFLVSTNVFTGTTSSDTLRSSATVYGVFGNAYSIFSSTPAALNIDGSTLTATSTFSGGRDRGFITINATQLFADTDFTVGASTAATATNIAAAINADATLGQIIVATATAPCPACGVVYATATTTGLHTYSISTSSRPLLTPSGFQFDGGTEDNINSETDVITKANTFPLAQGVYIGATVPTGLSAGTTYFAIPVAYGTSFKLATTAANAVAGTAIDISTTAAGSGSYTLTASTYTAGSAGFNWQSSNDNTNWLTLPSISSVTIPGSGVTTIGWDFGTLNYRYLRLNFTGPTRGCAVIDAAIQGKRD